MVGLKSRRESIRGDIGGNVCYGYQNATAWRFDALVILIDTREKLPFKFGDAVAFRRAGLQTGDYSILGLENEVAVERKSLDDLISSLSTGRERFQREIDRLVNFPTKAIVVEGSWDDIHAGNYRSKMSPLAAYGSIIGIIADGLPVLMCGKRKKAEVACYALLRIVYNRYQYRLRKLEKGAIIKAS